jgi:hypothetical protein
MRINYVIVRKKTFDDLIYDIERLKERVLKLECPHEITEVDLIVEYGTGAFPTPYFFQELCRNCDKSWKITKEEYINKKKLESKAKISVVKGKGYIYRGPIRERKS